MALTDSTTRIAAARVWFDALEQQAAPDWDDVELVVRLRLTDETVARQVLFTKPEVLLSRWRELQTALGGGIPQMSATAARPSATKPATGQHDAEVTPEVPILSAAADGRLTALTAWYQAAVAAGRDLDGISPETLQSIADAGPTQPRALKQFGSGANRFAEELWEVLRSVSTGGRTAVPAADRRKTQTTAPEEVAFAGRLQQASQDETASSSRASTAAQSGRTSPTAFADFDYAAVQPGARPPLKVSFAVRDDETLEMSWPAPADDGCVRIFRVVTNNLYLPDRSPLLGELIGATFDSCIVDVHGFSSPVRYVAIWMNEGRSEQDARAKQPTLYAVGGCVLPVRHCEVREDEGTVIGQWEATEGVLRVDVLRVPSAQAAQDRHYNHNYRLPAELVSRGGFTDDGATPGEEYEYRVYAVASVSGEDEELSPFVARRVKLQAAVHSVTDLRVEHREGSDSTYDLRWTMPPLGNVEIYRSEAPPAAGIDQVVLDRKTLVELGLTPDLKLARALDRIGDQGAMNDVPWPRGWSRAYFTPATVMNEEQIRVGRTEILTRSGSVSAVRLVERVDSQFLTFAWPEGVSLVKIYQSARGSELVSPETQHAIAELSEDDYNKYGGAHLPQRLPSEGCALHLVGTSFTRGRAVLSEPVTVQYAGLVRLRYDLIPAAEGRRLKRSQPETKRKVVAQSDSSPENVPLVVVHNANRLPLYKRDGHELGRRVLSFAPGATQVVAEQVDLGGLSGFVRLFADVPPDKEHLIAVLDPPVSHLRCGG